MTTTIKLKTTGAYVALMEDVRYGDEHSTPDGTTIYLQSTDAEFANGDMGVRIDWGHRFLGESAPVKISWYSTRTTDIDEAAALAEILQIAVARVREGK